MVTDTEATFQASGRKGTCNISELACQIHDQSFFLLFNVYFRIPGFIISLRISFYTWLPKTFCFVAWGKYELSKHGNIN